MSKLILLLTGAALGYVLARARTSTRGSLGNKTRAAPKKQGAQSSHLTETECPTSPPPMLRKPLSHTAGALILSSAATLGLRVVSKCDGFVNVLEDPRTGIRRVTFGTNLPVNDNGVYQLCKVCPLSSVLCCSLFACNNGPL